MENLSNQPCEETAETIISIMEEAIQSEIESEEKLHCVLAVPHTQPRCFIWLKQMKYYQNHYLGSRRRTTWSECAFVLNLRLVQISPPVEDFGLPRVRWLQGKAAPRILRRRLAEELLRQLKSFPARPLASPWRMLAASAMPPGRGPMTLLESPLKSNWSWRRRWWKFQD